MTDLNQYLAAKRGHQDGPEWTTLTDPNTGEPTPVSVRVWGDVVFIVHESGGTLVNIEVVVDGDGKQVVRTFVATPAVVIEDEGWGFFVIDTDVAAGGYTG